MTILAYVYPADIAGTDNQLAQTTEPKFTNDPYSTPLASNVANTTYTTNWYRQIAYDQNDANGLGFFNESSNAYPIAVAEIPSDSTEIWLRCLDFGGSTYKAYWSGSDKNLLAFYNIQDGVKRLVSKLYFPSGSGTLTFAVYDDAGTSIVKSHAVSAADNFRADATSKDCIADFRFVFDQVAGFIQHYDYSTELKSEVLGKTIGNYPVTHAVLYDAFIIPQQAVYGPKVVFRILANEPTFGMYVMPFLAKGEGSDQDHKYGTYARFAKCRKNFALSYGIALEKAEEGIDYRYSYLPNNLTEQGLPENHTVLSLSISSIIATTAPTADLLYPTTYLKDIATGEYYEQTMVPTKNNVDYATGNNPAVRRERWDKNPVTGQNWEPTDLSNFEIGFKI